MLEGVIACVLTLIVSALCVFAWNTFQSRFTADEFSECTEEQFKHVRLEPNYLLKLAYLISISDKILREANVRYCAIGGVLLAVERTGYLTPWDDDGDLCVFQADFDAHQAKLQSLLRKHGVRLVDAFWPADLGVFQLHFNDDHPMHQTHPTDQQPFVDWMLYSPEATNDGSVRMNFTSPRQRVIFPNSFLRLSELFPLRRQTVSVFSKQTARQLAAQGYDDAHQTVEFVTPNDIVSILNREYGTRHHPELWKTCFLASSHRSPELFIKACKLTEDQIKRL